MSIAPGPECFATTNATVMAEGETFARAFARVGNAAFDGAVGGAVCGAALGVVSMLMVGRGSDSAQPVLPVSAPYVERAPALLQSVVDVLHCVPESCAQYGVAIVRSADLLASIHDEPGRAPQRRGALATRSFATIKRAVSLCAARGGDAVGIGAAADSLYEQCDDMLFNIMLD